MSVAPRIEETNAEVELTTSEKKPYIRPHRHCLYCGRMIEVRGRNYCLKCKPDYEKEQKKSEKSKNLQKIIKYYAIGVVIVFLLVVLLSSL